MTVAPSSVSGCGPRHERGRRQPATQVVLAAIMMTFCARAGATASVRAVHSAAAAPVQSQALERPRDLQALDLSSVRRLYDASARQRMSSNEAERVASWEDLSRLVEAILGETRGTLRFDPVRPPRVIPTAELNARDTAAYQLLSLGYSAGETADVVSGRIGRQALDTAQRMLMAGWSREAAANYLDREYKSSTLRSTRPDGHEDDSGAVSAHRFAAVIEKYAKMHDVAVALVRAIIVVESAFDPGARSSAGAIGLMQLMPATARELGVNPSSPEANIEGGVRYLAELIEMFGGIELALVAYNGGPGFARRYARGLTPMYGETRAFVKRVLALARAQP